MGWASDEKVIQVVMNVDDALFPSYPLDCLGDGVEYVWSRPKAEGKDPIIEELTLPPHTQEVLFVWVHWTESKRAFDVYLGHEGSTT